MNLVEKQVECPLILLVKCGTNCGCWQVGATEIIAEEETEQMWYDLVGSVSASLSVKSLSGQKTGVKHWRAPLYDLEVCWSVRPTGWQWLVE